MEAGDLLGKRAGELLLNLGVDNADGALCARGSSDSCENNNFSFC